MKLSDYNKLTHFNYKPPFATGKFRLDTITPSKSLEYPVQASIAVVRENYYQDINNAGKEVTVHGEAVDVEYINITGP